MPGRAQRAADRQRQFIRIQRFFNTCETALETMSETIAFFRVHEDIPTAPGAAFQFPVSHCFPPYS